MRLNDEPPIQERKQSNSQRYANIFKSTIKNVPREFYHDNDKNDCSYHDGDEIMSPKSNDSTFKNKDKIKKLKHDILISKLQNHKNRTKKVGIMYGELRQHDMKLSFTTGKDAANENPNVDSDDSEIENQEKSFSQYFIIS